MSELVLSAPSTISIKYGDATYLVKKPSNKQLKDFQLEIKDKGEQSLDLVIGLLAKLGLPEDVSWELGPDSIEQISEALFPKKKG